MANGEIVVRRAEPDDLQSIIDVASTALGWRPGEPHEALFRWKHFENAFGESPMWVAESGGRIAGFRAFLRWELVDAGGRTWRAVRAVDTATHPDFRRRGVFQKLTTAALDEMRDEGVDIVFNTPNEQSRPGYLKMGWQLVGRLPVAFRPTGPVEALRMVRSRTAADKWSLPSVQGYDARLVLDEGPRLHALLDARRARPGLATKLSPTFLAWRYGLDHLQYRAWLGVEGAGDLSEGVVLFRLRRRGGAVECTVALVLAPDDDPHAERRLVEGLAQSVRADYLIRLGRADWRGYFLPVPKLGPHLTVREVCSKPPTELSAFSFELGDIELF